MNYKVLSMEEKDPYSELQSIRALMERSSKFISLSGLSGIMAGVYALVGSAIAYVLVFGGDSGMDAGNYDSDEPAFLNYMVFIALSVLLLSLFTGIWLTIRKARKKGEEFWSAGSKRLLINMVIPLFTGGIFILILLFRGQYEIIVPACLIFYGLALVSASHYTLSDVRWLGFSEIVLGLLAALVPGYGPVFWVIGFGFLHIFYGSIMYFKYDR